MAPACFDMSHNSDHFSMMFQAHLIFFLSSPRISCFSKGSWSLLLEIVLEAKILVLIPTGVPLSLVFFFFSGHGIYLEYIGIYMLNLEI